VPLIVSTTLDDSGYVRFDFDLDDGVARDEGERLVPGKGAAIVAAYRRAFPRSSSYLLLNKIVSDRGVRLNAYRLADRKAAQHRAPVYMYLLEYPSPANDGRWGAVHGTDIGLVFHNTAGQQLTGDGPVARQLAGQLAGVWVAFAKSGNPNHPGIPPWPAYTTAKRETMIFNATVRVENDPWSELRAFWS
jgi:para-nitrobenzyl esterase